MDLDGRAQSEEKGFRISTKLGGVVYVDDEVAASCAIYGSKVSSLGLKVLHYRLQGRGEPSILQPRVSLLRWDAERKHCAHSLSPFSVCPATSISSRPDPSRQVQRYKQTRGGRIGGTTQLALSSAVRNFTHLACSDELVLVRVGRGRSARGYTQFGEDVAHVPFHGPVAENQLRGDGLVCLA